MNNRYLTAPVAVRDIGSLEAAIKEFGKPKSEKYSEIDISWVDDAINQKLLESRFSAYDAISMPYNLWKASVSVGACLTVIASNGVVARSLDNGSTWEMADIIENITSATYGDNVYIAVANSGEMAKSSDGLNFIVITAPRASYSAITYCGGAFIAVASGGEIFRSTDCGLTWQEVIAGISASYTCIASDNNSRVVALANSGDKRCIISENCGASFTAIDIIENNQWVSVCYCDKNKRFIGCALDGLHQFAYLAQRGFEWKAATNAINNTWRSVASGGGIISAVASSGKYQAASSYDGITWYKIETPRGAWNNIIRHNNFFFAFAANNTADDCNIMRSSNGGLTNMLFADSVESIAGEESSKAISPKTLKEVLDYNTPIAGYKIADLPASKITSGELEVERIPNLDSSKITSGTLSADRIPALNANKINAGILDTDRIPNLDANKITSGTFNNERIASLDASKITTGKLNKDRLPNSMNNIEISNTGKHSMITLKTDFSSAANPNQKQDYTLDVSSVAFALKKNNNTEEIFKYVGFEDAFYIVPKLRLTNLELTNLQLANLENFKSQLNVMPNITLNQGVGQLVSAARVRSFTLPNGGSWFVLRDNHTRDMHYAEFRGGEIRPGGAVIQAMGENDEMGICAWRIL